jgi:hypothetical protein
MTKVASNMLGRFLDGPHIQAALFILLRREKVLSHLEVVVHEQMRCAA